MRSFSSFSEPRKLNALAAQDFEQFEALVLIAAQLSQREFDLFAGNEHRPLRLVPDNSKLDEAAPQVNRNCDCRPQDTSHQEKRSQSCLLVNLGMSPWFFPQQWPLRSTSEAFNP
jgi:hypothetical protein